MWLAAQRGQGGHASVAPAAAIGALHAPTFALLLWISLPQVGEVSYSQRNLFGLGQRLVASAKLGQVGAPLLRLVGALSFFQAWPNELCSLMLCAQHANP